MSTDDFEEHEEEFFPRGAITFFAVMVVAYGLIWLGLYCLLLHRQSGI